MNYPLKHIFDESRCLSNRQVKEYISGTMAAEECYSAEHHINSCPFCGEALAGMLGHREETIAAYAGLTNSFLKEHFQSTMPQVHLNSMAPAATMPQQKTQPFLRKPVILFIAVIGIAVVWYVKYEKSAPASAGSTKPAKAKTTNTTKATPAAKDAPPVAKIMPAPVVTPTNSTPPANNTTTPATALTPAAKTDAAKPNAKRPEQAAPAKLPIIPSSVHEDKMEQAKVLYEKENWDGALKQVTPEIAQDDEKQSREATLMAAKIYQKMGQNDKAKKLLESMVEERGPQRRAAKKMLRRMKNAED